MHRTLSDATHLVCRVCVAPSSWLWYPVDDGANAGTRSHSVTIAEQRRLQRLRQLVNSVGFDAVAFGCARQQRRRVRQRQPCVVLSWAVCRGRGHRHRHRCRGNRASTHTHRDSLWSTPMDIRRRRCRCHRRRDCPCDGMRDADSALRT